MAGRLKNCINEWRKITSDEITLNWVEGFEIPFKSCVYQDIPPRESSWSDHEIKAISHQINDLCSKGVLKKCKFKKNQFISKNFLRPKPDGSSRLILNLKRLNKFIKTNHFKLEDNRTAQKLVRSGCYMATLDLKDAYYAISISKKHRQYLRFSFQNELFEFQVLPFGLTCASYVFTKVMKPVAAFLRKHGYFSVVYLDDWFLLGNNYENCSQVNHKLWSSNHNFARKIRLHN